MERIDVAALRERLAGDEPPVLVDVRTAGEYAGGHVAEAVNLPLSTIGGHAATLKGRGEVHLICRSGNRSAQAAAILEQAGIKTVNVEGGTGAWAGSGFPIKAERSWRRIVMPAFFAFTLGLAPFAPEPHIVGKIRWIAGGAVGMGLMDWVDVLMHGGPWVWLIGSVIGVLRTPAD